MPQYPTNNPDIFHRVADAFDKHKDNETLFRGALQSALNQPSNKSFFGKALDRLDIKNNKLLAAGFLISTGAAVNKLINKINNDAQRKNIIMDLHLNDPVLKNIPEEQLLEWYATIYHFAPKFSLDKTSVREVLQNFARFGRVDVNTLKMLADTEKSMQQGSSYGTPWSSVLGDLARAVSFGG